MTATAISTRAVLVFVNIAGWDGQAYDAEASAKANRDRGADVDAARLNKQLIAKEALKPVQQACNRLRSYVKARTVPWSNDLRAVSTTNLIAFRQEVEQLAADIGTEAMKLGRIFDAEVRAAEKHLGELFKAEDYPTAQEVVSRFRVRVKYLPMPMPNDFRAQLDKELADKMREEMEADLKAATEAASENVVNRVLEVVGTMAERLKAYKGQKGDRLYDSVVINVRTLIDLLPDLNLTADPRIDELRDRLRDLVADVGVDASSLKEDANLRAQTAAKAKKILDRIAAMS